MFGTGVMMIHSNIVHIRLDTCQIALADCNSELISVEDYDATNESYDTPMENVVTKKIIKSLMDNIGMRRETFVSMTYNVSLY